MAISFHVILGRKGTSCSPWFAALGSLCALGFKLASLGNTTCTCATRCLFVFRSSRCSRHPAKCFSIAISQILLLSINRFERKKGIDLAVKALAGLKSRVPAEVYDRVKLVLAGGYDERVQENIEYYD